MKNIEPNSSIFSTERPILDTKQKIIPCQKNFKKKFSEVGQLAYLPSLGNKNEASDVKNFFAQKLLLALKEINHIFRIETKNSTLRFFAVLNN